MVRVVRESGLARAPQWQWDVLLVAGLMGQDGMGCPVFCPFFFFFSLNFG